MRRCIGCRQSKPQDRLIRFYCRGDRILQDKTGRAEGRGVYLCKKEECVERARKTRAFHRNFRCKLDEEGLNRLLDEVLGDLKEVTNDEKNQ